MPRGAARSESIIKLAAISLMNNDFGSLAEKIVSGPQTWKPVAEIIFNLVDGKKRIDLADLTGYLKQNQQSLSKMSFNE